MILPPPNAIATTLYVPLEGRVTYTLADATDLAMFNHEFRSRLLDRAGGFTSWKSEGAWQTPAIKALAERVTCFRIIEDAAFFNREWWRDFGSWLRKRLDEQEILIEHQPTYRVLVKD